MQKYFTNNDEKTKYEDEIYNLDKDVWAYYKSLEFKSGITINIDLLYTLEEDEKIEKIEKILAMETQYDEFTERLIAFEEDVRRDLYRDLSSINKKLHDIKNILFKNQIEAKYPSIDHYLNKFRNKLYKIKKNLFSSETLEKYPSIKIYLENLQPTGNPIKSNNSSGETYEAYALRNGLLGGGKPKKTRRHKNKKRRSSRRHKK